MSGKRTRVYICYPERGGSVVYRVAWYFCQFSWHSSHTLNWQVWTYHLTWVIMRGESLAAWSSGVLLLFRSPALLLPQTAATYCKKNQKEIRWKNERRLGWTTIGRLTSSSKGVLGTVLPQGRPHACILRPHAAPGRCQAVWSVIEIIIAHLKQRRPRDAMAPPSFMDSTAEAGASDRGPQHGRAAAPPSSMAALPISAMSTGGSVQPEVITRCSCARPSKENGGGKPWRWDVREERACEGRGKPREDLPELRDASITARLAPAGRKMGLHTANFDNPKIGSIGEILDGADLLNLLHQTRCMTYDQLQYNSKDSFLLNLS
jgi:hypothetical protein